MDDNHTNENIFDAQGFRFNVGIIIVNHQGKAFWAKRSGQDSWQFPQGGVNAGESSVEAMWRELSEETGLTSKDVELLAQTNSWLKYRLPSRYRRRKRPGLVQCIGQKQMWFLLRLISEDKAVNLSANANPEFDDWCWVDYWQPAKEVVYFKRKVYQQALQELGSFMPSTVVATEAPAPVNHYRKKVPSFAFRRHKRRS